MNYRANLWDLKSVGVERLICVSAVGRPAGPPQARRAAPGEPVHRQDEATEGHLFWRRPGGPRELRRAHLLVWVVSGASLAFLAVLGAVGAQAGGANVLRATARVTFWGALAMALTAGIGAVFGTVV